MTRRVDVIGGGPGGLYVARLLKLSDPGLEVTVHERMDGAGETFGFGVGLTEATMRNLREADPATAERVRAVSYAGHELHWKTAGRAVRLHSARNLAVGRAALRCVLAEAAVKVGVDYRPGSQADLTSVSGDVVIAADGVGSATRAKLAPELGVHTSLGRTRYMWCGTGFAAPSAFFSATARGGEQYVVHAYPYADNRSTFLIEVDDTTWASAGLGQFDSLTGPGETDERSVRRLEAILSAELAVGGLLTNRTRWSRFTNLSLDRWHAGNVALLGDAAHTAHYTLGSGTKLALEDAIALAGALAGEGSVPAALAAYQGTRRPAVQRFQQLASRSQRWWDSYRWRSGWPPERLGLSFMTRSGNLTMTDYADAEPEVVRAALRWLGEPPSAVAELDEWVLARAAVPPGAGTEKIAWSEPDVWGEAADQLVARVAAGPDCPVVLTAGQEPTALWARVDLAERLRLQTGRRVGVEIPSSERAFAATSIAAGRADFAVFR